MSIWKEVDPEVRELHEEYEPHASTKSAAAYQMKLAAMLAHVLNKSLTDLGSKIDQLSSKIDANAQESNNLAERMLNLNRILVCATVIGAIVGVPIIVDAINWWMRR